MEWITVVVRVSRDDVFLFYIFRLGELTCLADPKDLLSYKDTEAYSVIQELVLNCTRKGLDISKHLVDENIKVHKPFTP